MAKGSWSLTDGGWQGRHGRSFNGNGHASRIAGEMGLQGWGHGRGDGTQVHAWNCTL